MTRIEREKLTVAKMIEVYCRRTHGRNGDDVCEECRRLLEYCLKRLENCPKGESKPSCRKCPTHCYAHREREEIRVVMRYVGPRMILINPIMAIRHIITELK